MFTQHQPQIAEWAWRSPSNLVDTIMFARLTARRHLFAVPLLMDDYRENGIYALPMRIDCRAYQSAVWMAPSIYSSLCSPTELFYRVLAIPGFGMVKAGFVVQMLTGEIGCLDTHNIRRFGLDAKAFSTSGSWSTVYRRCQHYFALCEGCGGAKKLWDDWCNLVALLYPHYFQDGEAVSQLHVDAIVGR